MKNKGWLVLMQLGLFIVIGGCKKEKPIPEIVTDFDGNEYKTVTIGSQVWLAENLKTNHFNDGTFIQFVSDSDIWSTLSSPGCCYNENQLINKYEYGMLYNWQAVGTGKLCPEGWHVSTEKDWDDLVIFLGGEKIAGIKLMESGSLHWICDYWTGCVGTNESGFTARGGGFRNDSGTFLEPGYNGRWWCDTDLSSIDGVVVLLYRTGGMDKYSNLKKFGYSVRCVMDK